MDLVAKTVSIQRDAPEFHTPLLTIWGIPIIPLLIHFQVDEDLIDDLGEKKR